MGLEKSTYVSTQSNGRMEFNRDGDELRIEVINTEGNVIDAAMLGEDDLRSLVKDFFPAKRGPRKVGKSANGTRKSRQETATARAAGSSRQTSPAALCTSQD